MPRFSISLLVESAICDNIDTIAKLQSIIYNERPELYNTTTEIQSTHLKKVAQSKDSIAVMLTDNKKLVGIIIGLPLRYEQESIQKLWRQSQLDIDKIYYFSDLLLEKNYQKNHFRNELIDTAQEWIKSFNYYHFFTLNTIQSEDQHNVDNKQFLSTQGYKQLNDFDTSNAWNSSHNDQMHKQLLHFWIKKIQ